MAVNTKKTLVSFASTLSGAYTSIGSLYGEIMLPNKSVDNDLFLPNDAVEADLVMDDVPQYGDVELKLTYSNMAAFNVANGQFAQMRYWKFELANGDYFIYYGAIVELGPVTGTENKGAVGTAKFKFVKCSATGSAS